MYLGKVVGTVVAERKVKGLESQRLLVVQPLDHLQKPVGAAEVAVDTVSASPGCLVLLVGSREASLACEPWFVPVDSAIVGLVDEVDTSAPGAAKATAAANAPKARKAPSP